MLALSIRLDIHFYKLWKRTEAIHILPLSLSNYGEGVYTTGGGRSEVLPLQKKKGGGGVLAMLKGGGAQKVLK